MFGKKKKKILINQVFGEMEYWYGWYSTVKTEITLWNKTYSIDLFAVAGTQEKIINEKQEAAYTDFKKTIAERQKEIEKVIEEHCQIKDRQVLTLKFTPTKLLFGRNGVCGLYIDDNDEEYGPYDDHDVGLAVAIIPESKVYSQEEYVSNVFGSEAAE